MIKSYFQLAIRHLLKNTSFTIINIVGLSIGLAASFLIFLHVHTELSYDNHFKNAPDIHRIAVKASMSGNEFKACVTGGPLCYILEKEIPEIDGFTRIREGRMTLLTAGERSFYEEHFLYADSSFFKIFSFDLIQGDPTNVLIHPYTIVLTEKMAAKLFGSEDPVGKSIKWNNGKHFTVTGVIKDYDEKTHLDFDFLVSFSTLYQNERFRNFLSSLFNYSTLNYIKLRPGADPKAVELKMAEVVDKNMAERLAQIGGKYELYLQPITDIYLHSNVLHEMRVNGNASAVYILAAVAALILIIACINFINLCTARSAKRALEVGIRKVFGANKGMLFSQYILESVILVLLSLLLAIIIFNLMLPFFNSLSGNNFTTNEFLNWDYLLLVFGIVLLIGFLAGSYPAIFLARFKPVMVLKGFLLRNPQKSHFRNIMVVTQFVISILLIAGTLLIYRQLSYLTNKDLGVDQQNLVVIALRNSDMTTSYSSLKAEMKNLPGIIDVTGSSAYLGNFQQRRGFYPEGGDLDDMTLMLHMQVDPNYLDVLKANIESGRNFFENSKVDSNAIVINKSYQKELGWANPLGKFIYIPGNEGEEGYPLKIIGVVEDFNFASLHEKVMPLIIMNRMENVRYLNIRINPQDKKQVIGLIADKWEQLYPAYPFEFFMQQTRYEEMYTSEVNMGRLFMYFTILAIFIAGLGLFGLSSYTTEQRTREIGIRKVLGSSIMEVVILLSKEFVKLIAIALIIAVPISWFGMDQWLHRFAFQTNISWWIFVISGILSIAIAYLTIIYQTVKASRAKPVDSLKYE